MQSSIVCSHGAGNAFQTGSTALVFILDAEEVEIALREFAFMGSGSKRSRYPELLSERTRGLSIRRETYILCRFQFPSVSTIYAMY